MFLHRNGSSMTSFSPFWIVAICLALCGAGCYDDPGGGGDIIDDACDGICETDDPCPEDCDGLPFCGNDLCDGMWNEDIDNCPEDCENYCGDGICRNLENEFNCEADCGPPPLCGDAICDHDRGETDENCFRDCGCWNGHCDSEQGETELTCYQDCGECGNGLCSGPEDQYVCPEDCPRPIECGDLFCEYDETHESCPEDCHCGWDTCDLDETPETCPEDCAETCGDGECDESIGEDWLRCPVDCRACNDRDYPIDCGDGLGCWPAGTNCRSDVFVCGDGVFRCGQADYRANCCEDVFNSCPANTPYFCSDDGECYEHLDEFHADCNSADACTTLNVPCS